MWLMMMAGQLPIISHRFTWVQQRPPGVRGVNVEGWRLPIIQTGRLLCRAGREGALSGQNVLPLIIFIVAFTTVSIIPVMLRSKLMCSITFIAAINHAQSHECWPITETWHRLHCASISSRVQSNRPPLGT